MRYRTDVHFPHPIPVIDAEKGSFWRDFWSRFVPTEIEATGAMGGDDPALTVDLTWLEGRVRATVTSRPSFTIRTRSPR